MRHIWILAAIALICFGSADFARARLKHEHHGIVHVHGYYRKNGTYVHGYNRSSPSHHATTKPKKDSVDHRTAKSAEPTSKFYEARPGVFSAPPKTEHNSNERAARADHKPHYWARFWSWSSGLFAHKHKVKRNPNGRIERSTAAKDEFRRLDPCPSTKQARGPCPGYVIDHRIPLDCGGADAPSNMQWQTDEAAKTKDKIECGGHRCSKWHHTCSL
jgi:hypothetical protein